MYEIHDHRKAARKNYNFKIHNKNKKIIKLSPKPIVVYNLTFRIKMKFDTNKEN